MNYYIDIHNHCLPLIDDGPKSLEESLRILRFAYDQGIREIIVTPHSIRNELLIEKEIIEQRLKEVQEAALMQDINIYLHTGCELFYSSGLLNNLLSGRANTLGGSKYILIEFFPDEELKRIIHAVYEVYSAGYYPIIAHVERYEALREIKAVIKLVSLGAYIQVNSASVLGDEGRDKKAYIKKLLHRKLVHYIATDAHNMKNRKPKMIDCIQYIEKKFGYDYAAELSYLNAKEIIEHKEPGNSLRITNSAID
jgi:protein-tyrosine phosphatase